MGATRNVVLSVIAAGLLVVGLLVLVPQPVRAVQPQAPTVTVSDVGTSSDNLIKTTLTTVVIIPRGNLIPIEYAEIIVADGAFSPSFGGAQNRMNSNVLATCTASITSLTGASLTAGTFTGYGYAIVNDGYGYGYKFGDAASTNVLGQYGYTTGNGYGSTSGDVRVTVTLEVTNCPSGSLWTSTFRTFHFQAILGGGLESVFASLPTTLTVRDPEATFATVTSGNTASTSSITAQLQDGGQQTTINLLIQAGATLDGTDYTPSSGTLTYTLPPGAIDAFVTAISVTYNQPVPDGANVAISFNDMDTTGGTFPSGSTAFGIPAADLTTRTGGVALAGFFSLTMTGLPAGSSPGAYIDVALSLSVPTTYFTANGLSVGNFHLVRYSDAGVFLAEIPCTTTGTSGADTLFTCTITDFSSFAMVASAISSGGGGGGGGGVIATTSTTGTSTATGTDTATGTGTGTATSTGTQTTTGGGKGKGGSAPGLEFGLLAGALAGIALLARRKLK